MTINNLKHAILINKSLLEWGDLFVMELLLLFLLLINIRIFLRRGKFIGRGRNVGNIRIFGEIIQKIIILQLYYLIQK
jgi:hypothetical protein